MENTIIKIFYQTVYKEPTKKAIYCDNQEISYNDLFGKVLYKYKYLKKFLKQNDILCFQMENSIDSVETLLASIALGITLAPINPTLPIKKMFRIAKAIKAKYCLPILSYFHKMTEEEKALCIPQNIYENNNTNEKNNYEELNNQNTNSSFNLLSMTSGTTGEPKAFLLNEDCILNRIKSHIEIYKIKDNDIILSSTPLYHTLAERLVLISLLSGSTAVIMPSFTPNNWLKTIADQKVTFTIADASQLSMVSQLLSSPFAPEIKNLKCLVSSSSILEPHIKRELLNSIQCELHEIYGTSETSTVTDLNLSQENKKLKSVGKPFYNSEIKILNEARKELNKGEIGEITCKTKLAFKGYLDKQQQQEWFATGDLGKIDDDGFLYFCGRKQDLININGINVYPIEIEECLNDLSGIKECYAFAYPDERQYEIVAVAVVIDENSKIKEKDIKDYCKNNLADIQQPQKIFFLTDLPRNQMGKIQKNKLLEIIARQPLIREQEEEVSK